MKHHPIFQSFESVDCIGTGKHIFDFLGVATDTAFKRSWERFSIKEGSTYRASTPSVNEHYFDWIAVLESVAACSGTFRMAELGAGWGPWLMRALKAAEQKPSIGSVQLLGVEADPTHFEWMNQHFTDNNVLPTAHTLLHGAVASERTILKFPKIENPDEDYGASLRHVYGDREFVEVQSYPLDWILNRFDGPVDFLHSDIQGAEYEVFPPFMDLLGKKVKRLMVGTHISTEKHDGLLELFQESGWRTIYAFPRNEESQTEFGPVKFGDGFLYLQNEKLT